MHAVMLGYCYVIFYDTIVMCFCDRFLGSKYVFGVYEIGGSHFQRNQSGDVCRLYRLWLHSFPNLIFKKNPGTIGQLRLRVPSMVLFSHRR